MLVLTRKLGEQIIIGDNITLTVMELDRGRVRLAIDAPRDVPIHRAELRLPDPPASPTQPEQPKNCPIAALYQDEALEGGGSGG